MSSSLTQIHCKTLSHYLSHCGSSPPLRCIFPIRLLQSGPLGAAGDVFVLHLTHCTPVIYTSAPRLFPVSLFVPLTSTSIQDLCIFHFGSLLCVAIGQNTNTRKHIHKATVLCWTKWSGEVSNPVSLRVGLLRDENGTVGGSKGGDTDRQQVRCMRMSYNTFRWTQTKLAIAGVNGNLPK